MLLSTRQNRGNPQILEHGNLQQIQSSFYDPRRPLRVLIHGWFGDDTTDLNIDVSEELLNYNDFNVFHIDWSEGAATINYIGAANRVVGVGQFIAAFLDFLHEHNMLDWKTTKVIGFSLGAHAAGHTGKNVRRGRIDTIMGLDPAGPLFSVNNPAGRLDAGDADYVECIHTNGPTLLIAGAGIGAPIGHSDFFPNGGRSQPGCILNSCSHSRAVEFYVESVANNAFRALRCPTRDDINAGRCNGEPGEWMGGDQINFNKRTTGSFYLDTNRATPFAQGPTRS